MNYLKKIMVENNTPKADKKRTTIYISQSVYKKFKRAARKNKVDSISGVIERFMSVASEG